tara:strand:- start:204 stop:530 length:327 start_codon:yes stop_codon:yes gene_type:complete
MISDACEAYSTLRIHSKINQIKIKVSTCSHRRKHIISNVLYHNDIFLPSMAIKRKIRKRLRHIMNVEGLQAHASCFFRPLRDVCDCASADVPELQGERLAAGGNDQSH